MGNGTVYGIFCKEYAVRLGLGIWVRELITSLTPKFKIMALVVQMRRAGVIVELRH